MTRGRPGPGPGPPNRRGPSKTPAEYKNVWKVFARPFLQITSYFEKLAWERPSIGSINKVESPIQSSVYKDVCKGSDLEKII